LPKRNSGLEVEATYRKARGTDGRDNTNILGEGGIPRRKKKEYRTLVKTGIRTPSLQKEIKQRTVSTHRSRSALMSHAPEKKSNAATMVTGGGGGGGGGGGEGGGGGGGGGWGRGGGGGEGSEVVKGRVGGVPSARKHHLIRS